MVAEEVSEILTQMSWNDGCIGGCEMGRALVVNVNQLRYQTHNNSGNGDNSTTLRSTEYFFASLVDTTIIRLHQTRLVSHAENSTEHVSATATVPAIVCGNKKCVLVLGAVNALIVLAYVVECIRTRA